MGGKEKHKIIKIERKILSPPRERVSVRAQDI
jgi:hypothetical protein